MQKKWIFGILAIAVIVGGIYFGSPYLAARNLKQAAVSGNADTLEAAVDFPAVRESLKSQLNAQLMAKMQNDPEMKNNPFAGIGMMMIPAIIDKALDAYVTPHGIAALARGEKKPGAAVKGNENVEYDYAYVGLDRFRVKVRNKDRNDKPLGLLFERRGFAGWKLIRVEFPEDVFAGS